MKGLMTHLVAGYPDMVTSKKMFKSMIDLEIAAVELQIPFSDPIADGPILMHANDVAVASKVSVDKVFDMINTDLGSTKVYLMSYLQPILHYGLDEFIKKAQALGVSGLIIPDLPFDAPEISHILNSNSQLENYIVPVLSQGMSQERIEGLFGKLKPSLVYVTARHGITGDKTASFGKDLEQFVSQVRSRTDAKLALGFGIQTAEDVKKAAKLADIPVVGSAITAKMNETKQAQKLIEDLAAAARIV